jgi:hypothetical protein
MTIGTNSISRSYTSSDSPSITRTVGQVDRTVSFPTVRLPVSPGPDAGAHRMNRKRRTVLWLYNEDYEYLSSVAEHDMDSKNVSMHRLVKALRAAGVKSFLKFDEQLKRQQMQGKP